MSQWRLSESDDDRSIGRLWRRKINSASPPGDHQQIPHKTTGGDGSRPWGRLNSSEDLNSENVNDGKLAVAESLRQENVAGFRVVGGAVQRRVPVLRERQG